MSSIFHLPTRLYHGVDALKGVAAVARHGGMTHPVLVSDPVIAGTPYFAACESALREAFGRLRVFAGCGIDARLSHIEAEVATARRDGIDGVVAIGGGSVLCTGKGIAAAVRLAGRLPDLPAGRCAPPATILPLIGVPTTAGSGAEVSQFTVVKDDTDPDAPRKFVFGGPWAFPMAAILDPVVLSSLPRRTAAIAAIDAVTHAVEALFSEASTPLTDALATGALNLLLRSLRGSIVARDPAAQADNLLGSSMANGACGNTRLCLAHTLSAPLEAMFGLEHGVGVGVLIPHVTAFNGMVAPDRLARVAASFGVEAGADPQETGRRLVAAFHRLYDDIGFPLAFDAKRIDTTRFREIAGLAAKGLYGEGPDGPTTETTLIASPNIRKATVREAMALYERCMPA